MRAIHVSETGGPEVLALVETADPIAGPGELLVEVAVAGLNYIDTYHRKGIYPLELPFAPGVEGAGTVVAVGDGVDGFAIGDRVAWPWAFGSYAEKAVVPAQVAVSVPDEIGFEVAAALMVQGLTAHYLATSTYPLGADSTCLVHAGAGGVGLLLIQIAKRLGAVVHTTVGTPEKAALARAAGADHVIAYRDVDFVEATRELAGRDRPFDVVYDGVGAATFEAGLQVIRPRGLMVLFGAASGPVPPVDLQILNSNGSLFLTRPTLAHHMQTADELAGRTKDLFGWFAEGTLDVRIGHTFPLADAADAHRALEGRRTTGKVLLTP